VCHEKSGDADAKDKAHLRIQFSGPTPGISGARETLLMRGSLIARPLHAVVMLRG
jgi:hypothetical protein